MSNFTNAGLEISNWISTSPEKVKLVKKEICDIESLKKLKIHADSFLGQIVGFYEQLSVCNGFFHILCGEGNDSITNINVVKANGMPDLFPGALIIAYDKSGNIFALNAGADVKAELGNVLYMPKDSFTWEDLGFKYAVFLKWIFGITVNELEQGGWKLESKKEMVGNMAKYLIGKAAAYNMFLKQRR